MTEMTIIGTIESEALLIIMGTLMFTGFGIALILTARRMRRDQKQKITACHASTTGRIIRNEKSVTDRMISNRRRKMTTWVPVVRFVDTSGTVHEYRHTVSSNPSSYHQGETVRISYNPKNPRTFILPKDDNGSVFIFWFLIGFGILCFIAAAAFAGIGFLTIT